MAKELTHQTVQIAVLRPHTIQGTPIVTKIAITHQTDILRYNRRTNTVSLGRIHLGG